jgi:hypothetical protein
MEKVMLPKRKPPRASRTRELLASRVPETY